MTWPTLAVEVDLSGGDRFDTPVWTDLTDDVLALTARWGRGDVLDDLDPGALSVTLDNTTRAYDPRNTAGPHHGPLTPGRRCRVSATYDETAGATAISYVGIGAGSAGNNTSLTPALPASLQAGDLMLCLASIRNSGTGIVAGAAGWEFLPDHNGNPMVSGNVALLARFYQPGDTAPTVTFTGGVSGATTLAQVAAWRGTHPHLDGLVHVSATQLNSAGQNINVGTGNVAVTELGLLMLAVGWKQDDWTAAAQLTGQGFTEISEYTSTTGDDASHCWDYRIQPHPTSFLGTFFTITGGTSQISRSMVIAIRPYRGTTYQIWDGWTDGWPNQFAAWSGQATMQASGPFKWLARQRLADVYSGVIAADTPEGWWRLNSSTRLLDETGNGHHGRWAPTPVDTTSGLIASDDDAVSLPSREHLVGIVPASSIPALYPLSIEFWIIVSQPPTSLEDPLDLGSEDWSGIIAGGGINIRVYGTDLAWPGALDFIVVDGGSLALANIGVATTAYDTHYYNIADGKPHHVVCTINAAANFMAIWVDGVDRAPFNDFTGTLTAVAAFKDLEINPAPGWQGRTVMDELAIYTRTLTSAEVLEHYEAGHRPWEGHRTGDRIAAVLDLAGWPTGLTDLDAGQTVLGVTGHAGEQALDYLALVVTTEQGLLAEAHDTGGIRFTDRRGLMVDARHAEVQVLFSDDPTDLAAGAVSYREIGLASDDRPAANVVTVSWLDGTVEIRDDASVDAYGEITASVSTIIGSRSEAEALAQWVLTEQSALFHRVTSLTVRPSAMTGADAHAAWHALLGLREGDRVRAVHTPGNVGDPLDQELIVLGVEHKGDGPGHVWETTVHVAAAVTTEYWLLGTSELGTETRLAY